MAKPFFLAADEGGLTAGSVAKAVGIDHARAVSCHMRIKTHQTCSSVLGDVLVFDFTGHKGGVASILGATSSDMADRGTLAVMPFTCSPM